jgi:hypothetical protein
MAACTKAETPSSTSLYQIPWPTGTGDYRLQNVPIKTLYSPDTFSGNFAHIIVDPYVADGALQGHSVGRYIDIGENTFVPADYATVQATALYAHLEKLAELDELLGVSAKINWPLKIGLNANVVDERGAIRNNALYDGRLDSLLIVPYVEGRLPITINAGVIAHEHFHKIFQVFVMDRARKALSDRIEKAKRAGAIFKMSQDETQDSALAHAPSQASEFSSACNWATPPPSVGFPELSGGSGSSPTQQRATTEVGPIAASVYNEFLLRGINEGLADFWGWVYSGDSNFIGRSLSDRENESRRLDVDTKQLPSPEIMKVSLASFERNGQSDAKRIGYAYSLGTYYSRFMRGLALKVSGGRESDFLARVEVARALLQSLPSLGQQLEALIAQDEFISPNVFLNPLYENLATVTVAVCDELDHFTAPEGKIPVAPKSCKKVRETSKGASGEGQGGGKSPPPKPRSFVTSARPTT